MQVVDAPHLKDLFGLSLAGAWNAFQGILQWRRERRGLLTTNFAEAGGFIKSRPEEPLPDLQLHFVIGKLINHGRTNSWGHGFSCHLCLLRPRSRGSVRLANADPSAMPLVDPNFLGDPDDVERMVRGFKLMRGILTQPALASAGMHELRASASVQTDAEIESFLRNRTDTIYHPAGSCRMGRDTDAVVDSRLKVHGMSGLRVVDGSVMPRLVSGNTNAPIIMIAEKAADMIRADAAGG